MPGVEADWRCGDEKIVPYDLFDGVERFGGVFTDFGYEEGCGEVCEKVDDVRLLTIFHELVLTAKFCFTFFIMALSLRYTRHRTPLHLLWRHREPICQS